MSIISDLFGKSPFGALVEHTKKVHECVEMIEPLMEALSHENFLLLRELHNKVSKLEYEADKIKHEVRGLLSRRLFLPVDKIDLENFLRCQDKIADYTEDFSVILSIRNTKIHPSLIDKFFKLVNQVFQVTGTLLTAAVELQNLAEVSFSGAESKKVLKWLDGLGEEEWKADRIARDLSRDIYKLEHEVDTMTIIFYEKMILTLGQIANEAENAGDMLRNMLIR